MKYNVRNPFLDLAVASVFAQRLLADRVVLQCSEDNCCFRTSLKRTLKRPCPAVCILLLLHSQSSARQAANGTA